MYPRWPERRPRWLPPEFDWVVGCSYRGLPETVSVVRNPIGASMSLRTSLALEAGGFDDAVGRVGTSPRGCEETELAIRLTASPPGVDHLLCSRRGRRSLRQRRAPQIRLLRAPLLA